MIGNVASHSEGSGLRPSPTRFVLGLFLFATIWTWGLIPWMLETFSPSGPLWPALLHMGFTYFLPGNMGWLYFLPGLVLALIYFGCLRLGLQRQRNEGGWLRSVCAVSITLAVLENALLLLFTCDGNIVSGWTRYSLGFVVSLTVSLFISGVLSACCWAMPSRKPLPPKPPVA